MGSRDRCRVCLDPRSAFRQAVRRSGCVRTWRYRRSPTALDPSPPPPPTRTRLLIALPYLHFPPPSSPRPLPPPLLVPSSPSSRSILVLSTVVRSAWPPSFLPSLMRTSSALLFLHTTLFPMLI